MSILHLNDYIEHSRTKHTEGYIQDIRNTSNQYSYDDNPMNAVMHFIDLYSKSSMKQTVEQFKDTDSEVVFAVVPPSASQKNINKYVKLIGERMFKVPFQNIFHLNSDLTSFKTAGINKSVRRTEVPLYVDITLDLSNVSKVILLDDITNTGITLQSFSARIKQNYPDIEVLCIALSKEREGSMMIN